MVNLQGVFMSRLRSCLLLATLGTVVACNKNVCGTDFSSGQIGKSVYFEYDHPKRAKKSELNGDQEALCKETAEAIKKAGDIPVTVEGHCDRWGPHEYNDALGTRRAGAVKECLVHHGVAADKINVISYGKREQPNPNANTPEEDAQNRVAIVRRA